MVKRAVVSESGSGRALGRDIAVVANLPQAAATIAGYCICPEPAAEAIGISKKCRWPIQRPAARIAAGKSTSSIFMWKRSASSRTLPPGSCDTSATSSASVLTASSSHSGLAARRAAPRRTRPRAATTRPRASARHSTAAGQDIASVQRPCIEPMIVGTPNWAAVSIMRRMAITRRRSLLLLGQAQMQLMPHPAGPGPTVASFSPCRSSSPRTCCTSKPSGPGGKISTASKPSARPPSHRPPADHARKQTDPRGPRAPN